MTQGHRPAYPAMFSEVYINKQTDKETNKTKTVALIKEENAMMFGSCHGNCEYATNLPNERCGCSVPVPVPDRPFELKAGLAELLRPFHRPVSLLVLDW